MLTWQTPVEEVGTSGKSTHDDLTQLSISPYFVSLRHAVLCRDGTAVHINYKAQFADKPKSKLGKPSNKRKGKTTAEPIDLNQFDDEGQWQQQDTGAAAASDDDRQNCSSAQSGDSAEESGSQQSPSDQPRHGRWAQHNNRKVRHSML